MGVGLVFCCLMLLWLTPAIALKGHKSRSCTDQKCGNVTVSYPFGIEDGCYANPWFQVTCNTTFDGRMKPYLKRLNLELLISYSDGVVLVNNPVLYFNCSNNEDNNNVIGAFTRILRRDSPFSFPTSLNSIGSVGCGNLAIIHANQTPIGGCLQPGCGDGQYCYIRHIEEDLNVLAANMTEILPSAKESNGCSSAFVFDYYSLMDSDGKFPRTIGIETTHVPASLVWTLDHINITCHSKECQEPGGTNHYCTRRCGNARIEWPFGIESGCYMNEWFRVSCNKSDNKVFLDKIGVEFMNTSLSRGEVIVKSPITTFSCHAEGNGSSNVNVNLTSSPFSFSTSNILRSVGCGSLITVFHNQMDHRPIGGCLLPGNGDGTSGIRNGCDIPIPPGLSSFVANTIQMYSSNNCSKISCPYTFMYNDRAWLSEEISLDDDNISSMAHVPSALQFATPKFGLCDLREGPNFSCSSDGRYCWTNLTSTHLCVCSYDRQENTDNDPNHYDGYLTDVCIEAGKCEESLYKFCSMLCFDEPGGNSSCSPTSCPTGYVYDRNLNWCKPKQISSKDSAVFIGCSTSIGTLLLLLATSYMYKVLKRRENMRRKQRYFKQLLQQQFSCNEGKVEPTRIFTSKELEKATDYYNENWVLGKGAQGTVYKGMLADGRIVAIKKSKVEKDDKKPFLDERQLEQWVNEVMILSQINHRNVVKLLGCCLQFPLLVYEFVQNGTLFHMIHEENEEFPLTWEMRLRIAIEAANALSYLHSAASVPIYHRDVKSTNILLDDKYRAKVSDFGISRSIGPEQTHLTTQVQGTFGYLDPEYFRSYKFTEKSDVYSFGVVLVELLTGEKPFSFIEPDNEVRILVQVFLLSMKENSLFNILDPRVRNDGPEEEIIAVSRLAKRCLNLNGKKRPTMKQVAMELESIRAASTEDNLVQQLRDVDEDDDSENEWREPWAIASCSTTSITLSNNNILMLPVPYTC